MHCGTGFTRCWGCVCVCVRGWFGKDSSAFCILGTSFLLVLHQLHLRSSGIRSQRLGTPTLRVSDSPCLDSQVFSGHRGCQPPWVDGKPRSLFSAPQRMANGHSNAPPVRMRASEWRGHRANRGQQTGDSSLFAPPIPATWDPNPQEPFAILLKAELGTNGA